MAKRFLGFQYMNHADEPNGVVMLQDPDTSAYEMHVVHSIGQTRDLLQRFGREMRDKNRQEYGRMAQHIRNPVLPKTSSKPVLVIEGELAVDIWRPIREMLAVGIVPDTDASDEGVNGCSLGSEDAHGFFSTSGRQGDRIEIFFSRTQAREIMRREWHKTESARRREFEARIRSMNALPESSDRPVIVIGGGIASWMRCATLKRRLARQLLSTAN